MKALLDQAIQDEINLTILYRATGLDAISFGQYYQDDLFSSDQREAIRTAIKEWRSML